MVDHEMSAFKFILSYFNKFLFICADMGTAQLSIRQVNGMYIYLKLTFVTLVCMSITNALSDYL